MADIKEFRARVVGVRPLIVHNAQLVDPLNDYVIRIAELVAMGPKAKKQEDVQMKLARIEFEGSMYLNEKKHPVIPCDNLLRLIRDGGAEQRNGKKLEACVNIVEDTIPIEYKGPRDIDEMFNAKGPLGPIYRFRKQAAVGQATVMRTRPRFPEWALEFTIQLVLGAGIGEKNVRDALEDAGRLKGLGDWRPRYGLFVVESWGEVKNRKAALAWLGRARRGTARQGRAWQGWARLHRFNADRRRRRKVHVSAKARLGSAGRGTARHGWARQGWARLHRFKANRRRRRKARVSAKAWQGTARRGWARRGMAGLHRFNAVRIGGA